MFSRYVRCIFLETQPLRARFIAEFVEFDCSHCVIGFVGDAAAAKTIGDEWATIKTEADDSNADLGACRVEKERYVEAFEEVFLSIFK